MIGKIPPKCLVKSAVLQELLQAIHVNHGQGTTFLVDRPFEQSQFLQVSQLACHTLAVGAYAGRDVSMTGRWGQHRTVVLYTG